MVPTPNKSAKEAQPTVGVFTRIVLFFKQVIAELKKVVWPTRDELSTYFSVVIVFVIGMIIFTGIVDISFSWIVSKVFGG